MLHIRVQRLKFYATFSCFEYVEHFNWIANLGLPIILYRFAVTFCTW